MLIIGKLNLDVHRSKEILSNKRIFFAFLYEFQQMRSIYYQLTGFEKHLTFQSQHLKTTIRLQSRVATDL